MKKLVLLAVVVLVLIIAFFYLIEEPIEPRERGVEEGEESSINVPNEGAESEEPTETVKTVETISDVSSSSEGSGGSGGSGGGGDEGGIEDNDNTNGGSSIPDPNVTECGTYFQSHGVCDGRCPEGECVSEGMSCYCKIA